MTEARSEERAVRWKRILQSLVSVAVIVGIFAFALPRIADYGEVFSTIDEMTGLEIGSLVLVGLWNLATYWFVLVAALPGLRLREAAVVNQSSTAVSNTLPAGGAIGVGVTVAMLTSWGFRVTDIGRSAVVTGIWNNFVKLGMPVFALALLALEGDVTPARVTSAVIGLAVLAAAAVGLVLLLRSDQLAFSIGKTAGLAIDRARRWLRKPPVADWGERTVRFRRDAAGLLGARWFALTSATLLSHVSLYLVLLVALRHVGVGNDELSWVTVLAAFAFVRLISALPITPGGVGVVELGYAAVLTLGVDAATSAQVVAAILVFRGITYLLPIPLGAASYLVWRVNQRWRMSESARDRIGGRQPMDVGATSAPPV